jgi:hypothetical protein
MNKFTALVLVFSMLTLFGNLCAAKKGAELVVIKKDETPVRGELIVVKENSLLLLSESGADVSIDIKDIKMIWIVEKSRASQGSGIGFFVGGDTETYADLMRSIDPPGWFGLSAEEKAAMAGMVLGDVGLIIGAIGGAIEGIEKTVIIEGKSEAEIEISLKYLRKKARIKNYK